jgi:prophage tail gpP-like protein
MTTTITPGGDQSFFTEVGPGAIQKILEKTGKLPPVSLEIVPLNPLPPTGQGPTLPQRPKAYLDRFLAYQFATSVTVPVDVFSFKFAAPDSDPINQTIKVGDIITLYANLQPISTGIIDQVEVEITEGGEQVSINGRNLLGQLEDQECVNPDSSTIFAKSATIDTVLSLLLKNTRIQQFLGTIPQVVKQQAPTLAYLFATEPGESKLAALHRYLEPLNCLVWMAPTGQIKIGKPNMTQTAIGAVYVSKTNRDANCLDMRVTRTGTQIPSIIVPVHAGSEQVLDKLAKQQAIYNTAEEPNRLRTSGHVTTKCVIVSSPSSGDPSEFPTVTSLRVASQQTKSPQALLQTYALRELARQNMGELQVQATVPGHYNDTGQPYLPDQTYRVTYDRGDIDEILYLYEVQYQLDEAGGQRSLLRFCRPGTIVSQQVAR